MGVWKAGDGGGGKIPAVGYLGLVSSFVCKWLRGFRAENTVTLLL